MDIQIGSQASIATPASGYRTLFINTDKGNALYYKNSDGTFTPFTGDADTDMTEIAEQWSRALLCALNSGMINAADYENILATGMVIVSNTTTDTNGNVTTTVSIGSRTIPLTSITLDSSAVSLAAVATHQIVTTFSPTNVTDKGLTYVSSDPTKATVSATGLITGVATGSSIISVIPGSDVSKTKTVTVTVTP